MRSNARRTSSPRVRAGRSEGRRRPAAPPAKAWASLGDAALVEETDVERVTAGDQWVGIDPVGISIADVELTNPVRNVERHVRVTALVILREGPAQDAVGWCTWSS